MNILCTVFGHKPHLKELKIKTNQSYCHEFKIVCSRCDELLFYRTLISDSPIHS